MQFAPVAQQPDAREPKEHNDGKTPKEIGMFIKPVRKASSMR